MTYYNTVHHAGHERFAAQLVDAGIVAAHRARPAAGGVGAVVRGGRRRRDRDGDARRADGARRAAAADRRPGAGLRVLGRAARVSPVSATRWPATATALAARLKAITDVPVLVGVGVSNAAQALEAHDGRRLPTGW